MLSLRKIIKSSNTEEVNTFQLHYFPNIPAQRRGDEAEIAQAGAVETPAGQHPASRGVPVAPGDPDREQRQAAERRAYEEGFAQGEKDGRVAAERQSGPLLTALETLLGELDGIRNRIRQHLETEVVELALQVARKVIRHELTVSNDAILCVVKEAMGNMEDPGRIAIRLNPEDLKRIRGAGEQFECVMENRDSLVFEEDPGIECGGCYIQTEFGDIDARIQEQLRAVEEAFRAELRTPAADPELT